MEYEVYPLLGTDSLGCKNLRIPTVGLYFDEVKSLYDPIGLHKLCHLN